MFHKLMNDPKTGKRIEKEEYSGIGWNNLYMLLHSVDRVVSMLYSSDFLVR